jgi:hypothetical protein
VCDACVGERFAAVFLQTYVSQTMLMVSLATCLSLRTAEAVCVRCTATATEAWTQYTFSAAHSILSIEQCWSRSVRIKG